MCGVVGVCKRGWSDVAVLAVETHQAASFQASLQRGAGDHRCHHSILKTLGARVEKGFTDPRAHYPLPSGFRRAGHSRMP